MNSDRQMLKRKLNMYERNYLHEIVYGLFEKKYPQISKHISIEQQKEIVIQLIEEAKTKGFTQRGSIRTYIELSIIFGKGVMENPLYLWISDIWGNSAAGTEIDRAYLIYLEVNTYLNEVENQTLEFFSALREFLADYRMGKIDYIYEQELSTTTHFLLGKIHPKRYQRLSLEAVEALIELALDKAKFYEFVYLKEIILLIILMFSFGCQFDQDPFQSWIYTPTNSTIPKYSPAGDSHLSLDAEDWIKVLMAYEKEYEERLLKRKDE